LPTKRRLGGACSRRRSVTGHLPGAFSTAQLPPHRTGARPCADALCATTTSRFTQVTAPCLLLPTPAPFFLCQLPPVPPLFSWRAFLLLGLPWRTLHRGLPLCILPLSTPYKPFIPSSRGTRRWGRSWEEGREQQQHYALRMAVAASGAHARTPRKQRCFCGTEPVALQQ